MKVRIEVDIAPWWRAEEYDNDMATGELPMDDRDANLIEMFGEDISALLDGAAWTIVREADNEG